MTDLVPDTSRIDRAALERIIRRAAEIHASERDIGDGLTESELMSLGRDVGIPDRYLRQALFEERSDASLQHEPGLAAWLAGPRRVVAQRSVPGNADKVRAALNHWMTERELLTVKRRFPDSTTWEPRRDIFSSLKRDLGVGGRPYRLARAREIAGQVSPLDQERCHVHIVADLSNTRRSHIGGGATLAASGALATTIGITLGVMLPVAVVPAGVGMIAGAALARRRLSQVEAVHVSLEQILDRLEHGELKAPEDDDRVGNGVIERLTGELRRGLGI
jgi:hypothetical protein